MMTNGLTKLVLCDKESHYLRDLLDYLDHCKNLGHLKIELRGVGGIVPASRIVSLPNLRELELVHSTPAVLYHLSFPPSTDLTIQLNDTIYVRTERYPFVDLWTEPGLLHIFDPRTIKGIKMMFIRSTCVVGLSGSHFTLTVRAIRSRFSGPSSFYSDCLDSLQSLPIKTTEFFGFAQPPSYSSAGALR